MLIGLAASRARGTSICALHEHMKDLAASAVDDKVIFRIPSSEHDEVVCDVVVTEDVKLTGAVKLRGSKVIVMGEEPGLLRRQRRGGGGDLELVPVLSDGDVGNVVAVGVPRIDVLCGSGREKEAIRLIFLRYHGLDTNARTLLYATTAVEAMSGFHFALMLELVGELGMNLVVWIDRWEAGIDKSIKVLLASEEKDSVPALIAADVLMTESSDFAVDYLVLNRPILFLESAKSRLTDDDFMLSRGKVGTIVRSFAELKEELSRLEGWKFRDRKFDVRKRFARRLLGQLDGNSAERALDAVIRSRGS